MLRFCTNWSAFLLLHIKLAFTQQTTKQFNLPPGIPFLILIVLNDITQMLAISPSFGGNQVICPWWPCGNT